MKDKNEVTDRVMTALSPIVAQSAAEIGKRIGAPTAVVSGIIAHLVGFGLVENTDAEGRPVEKGSGKKAGWYRIDNAIPWVKSRGDLPGIDTPHAVLYDEDDGYRVEMREALSAMRSAVDAMSDAARVMSKTVDGMNEKLSTYNGKPVIVDENTPNIGTNGMRVVWP